MSFGQNIDDLVSASPNALHAIHESWARVRVREVANLVNGFPFKSNGFNDKSGTPIVRIRDVTSGVPGTYYDGLTNDPKMTWIENGHIAIGMDGDFNSRVWSGGKALLNQRVCTLKADRDFYSQKFLAYVLPGYLNLINEHTSSVTVKHLSSLTVRDIPLPLPPLNEQHRIVEKIETLFAQLDQGEAVLREAKKLLARYRQSVLKAAVTGELTAGWRAQRSEQLEHGRDLLARILKTRREQWQGRGQYKEPAAPDITDLPELPQGWVWCSTEQLADVQTGATPKKGDGRFYAEGKKPWITSTAVNDDLIIEPQAYITEIALRETNAKIFPKGTLIVAMYGEGKTRGKVAELGIDAATNQACAALLVGALPKPVREFLKGFYLYNYEAIRLLSSGGVQPNLNLSLIKETALPLASEVELIEIQSRIDLELGRIQAVSKYCQSELARSAALRQSILKDAFTGKLVPQDPSDEPATELLARIRGERTTATRKSLLRKENS
ncbi:Type I restriction-modification system, specificity subunit S [plant metagenome]|uniref:Type I restriction-modification system, specificity subunit S n=1 Tax=plant metagenome TaxID=1297885 RepID=A0A484PIU4_9ZZZZ